MHPKWASRVSINLSAFVSSHLSKEDLYRLPEVLNRISIKHFVGEWHWYECAPPELKCIDNFESLIKDGFLWIEGPNKLSIHPSRDSIKVYYGWAHSRFFTKEKGVYDFVNFCMDLPGELACKKVLFVTDSECENLGYNDIEKLISSGEYSEADENARLSEYCDHDVYSKHII